MIKAIKKLFGGIDLTWPKLIVSAVAAGVLTAVIVLTVICLLNPPVYSTEIMGNGE